MGKCHDKLKTFTEAIKEYQIGLKIYKTKENQENSVKGSILFRIGWSHVRNRQIKEGVDLLR